MSRNSEKLLHQLPPGFSAVKRALHKMEIDEANYLRDVEDFHSSISRQKAELEQATSALMQACADHPALEGLAQALANTTRLNEIYFATFAAMWDNASARIQHQKTEMFRYVNAVFNDYDQTLNNKQYEIMLLLEANKQKLERGEFALTREECTRIGETVAAHIKAEHSGH